MSSGGITAENRDALRVGIYDSCGDTIAPPRTSGHGRFDRFHCICRWYSVSNEHLAQGRIPDAEGKHHRCNEPAHYHWQASRSDRGDKRSYRP
jgi:hypothetical protein